MSGNISDLLRAAAANHPDSLALISDDISRTWRELDLAADVGAAALRDRGLRAGERVLLHLPTGPELAAALFAVARADLVAVPIDPQRSAPEIAGRLGAAAVLTTDVTGVEPSVAIDAPTLAGWWDAQAVAPIEPSSGGEDIAMLARASRGGRAVMLSHRALIASVEAIVAAPELRLTGEDRVLLVLPLFHLAGFITAFLPLTTVGAAAVIADTPPVTGPNVVGTTAWTRFSTLVLKAVHTHRVTVIPGAPPLYRLLLRSNQLERSLATVRLMTSASSPLNPEDGAAVRHRTGSPVWEGYGISEAASAVASTLMTSVPRPGSVGLPLPGVEIRIETALGGDDEPGLEDDGTLASLEAEADPGVISIRGPQLFSGYWPDGAEGPDAEGWFTTTDIGYLDSRGELHLIDRIAETVPIAGFTVYPREVESALLAHPFVRDVAVVGLPGPNGPELAAALVATQGTAPTDDDLTEHLATLLPTFKRPQRYRTVRILPRTELGRLDRDLVRAEWASALGWDLGADHPVVKLSVVSRDPETPAEPVTDTTPPPEPPEVMEVSQLDLLGSRLPGVGSRSRRSAEDTDSDLFGEDVFGAELVGDEPEPTP